MSDEQQLDTLTVSRARKRTLANQDKFLVAYAECGVVKYACLAAGVTRQTFYNWRDHDQEFQKRFPDIKSDAIDTLEYAAYVQAVLGVEEPVVSAGKLIYNDDGTPRMIRKHSPQILITLLKANLPEKYKDKQQVEHTGSIDLTGARELLKAKLQSMREQEGM